MTDRNGGQARGTHPFVTPRMYELLRSWDGAYGVIFVGSDAQRDARAMECATQLGGRVLPYSGESKEDWRAQLGYFQERELQGELLADVSERVCVLVLGLDERPEWMLYQLKSIMDRHVRPVVVVTTVADLSKIPDWLSSHFYRIADRSAQQ